MVFGEASNHAFEAVSSCFAAFNTVNTLCAVEVRLGFQGIFNFFLLSGVVEKAFPAGEDLDPF